MFSCIFGRDINKDFTYSIPQKDQQFVPIEEGDTVMDVGVIFDEKVKF